jgi:hypothetical protein
MIKFSVGSISKLLTEFFKKINSPYKVSIVNEDTMQEAIVMHLTKKSVYLFLSSIFIGLFLLFSVVILFTPLRYYIPGNSLTSTRSKLIRIQKLSDSLVKINKSREKFIYDLLLVTNGHISLENDTSILTPKQIEEAIINNSNQIDHVR